MFEGEYYIVKEVESLFVYSVEFCEDEDCVYFKVVEVG